MRPHPLQEPCLQELQALVSQTAGIDSATVVTGDGFEVASVLRDSVSPQRLAAMVSSLLMLSEAVAGELGMQRTQYVVVNAESGAVIAMRIPLSERELLISVLCSGDAGLGMVLFATRDCAQALARVLGSK